MYTCVYCRKQSERRFPREHVIPQSFGKFKGALTLRCVCGDCNRYLANNLELFLGRDSHESFRRLQYAMKPMSEAGELRGTRVTATIAPGNSWSGARVVFGYDEQQRKLVVIPLPQVGFQAFDGSWIWFMESELTGPEAVAKAKREQQDIKIFGSPEEQQRLIEKLESFGIKFHEDRPMESPVGSDELLQVDFVSDVDRTIVRAISKIAFNYLAFVKGADFALKPDFDKIRCFIRYDQLSEALPLNLSDKPIIWGESRTAKATNGHLISLEWDRTGYVLICRVSLFNVLTYEVYLCTNFKGIWHDITSGHHFDIQSMTVAPLKAARITVPVRRR